MGWVYIYSYNVLSAAVTHTLNIILNSCSTNTRNYRSFNSNLHIFRGEEKKSS